MRRIDCAAQTARLTVPFLVLAQFRPPVRYSGVVTDTTSIPDTYGYPAGQVSGAFRT